MARRAKRKRTTKAHNSIDVEKEVDAWLASSQMDKRADYLKRGSPLSSLSDQELCAQWEQNLRGMANAPADLELLAKHTDLGCEFERRGSQPAYATSVYFEKWQAAFRKDVEAVLADPEKYAQISDSVAGDLAEFIANRSEKGN